MITKTYYPGEPVNIHIQSLINIIQEKKWVITTKDSEGKLPLFCSNRSWVIPVYVTREGIKPDPKKYKGSWISGDLKKRLKRNFSFLWSSTIGLCGTGSTMYYNL